MTEPEPEYTYPSDAEFEAKWVAAHRRHRVEVGAGNWLQCLTCGIPIKLTTMDAFAVVREIQLGARVSWDGDPKP